VFSRNKVARWRKALFLVAAEALAMRAEACFACWPKAWTCSAVFNSVIQAFSQMQTRFFAL
jgi:hypothetical protein